MQHRTFRLAFTFFAASGALATSFLACGGSDGGSIGDPSLDSGSGLDTGKTPAPADGAIPPSDGASPTDGASGPTLCEQTKAYALGCGATVKDLNCGEKFDAWCQANDSAINSAAFRAAQKTCLVQANCMPNVRKNCEYKVESAFTPTTAQKKLVEAYCATCEPGVGACLTSHTTYDPNKGPNSVDDVFVAAWELADPVVDEIRTKCLGADAGAGDAGSCLKTFAGCAADVYLSRVPDCP